MTDTENFFVKCVKCGIKNEKVSIVPGGIDFERLYKLCICHSMGVIVLSALENVKSELPSRFLSTLQNSVHKEIVSDVQSEYDKNLFLSSIDKRGIKHMLLKGYYLKKLYPSTAMRYTSDCDILIDKSQIAQISELVKELGLKIIGDDEHHQIVYFPATKTVFELHKTIFVGRLNTSFGDGFSRAHLKNGTNSLYEFTPEDFYISILGHSAYHFAKEAGVGIRHLTDICVYKNAYKLNYEYLDTELEKCGLLKFKNQFENVTDCLFNDKDFDAETLLLAEHIINSSLLSNKEKRNISDIAVNFKNKSVKAAKIKTLFKKIFPPKEQMQFLYPILKRIGILLPIFYFIRIAQILFNRPKSIMKLKEYKAINKSELSEMEDIRTMLGIENL